MREKQIPEQEANIFEHIYCSLIKPKKVIFEKEIWRQKVFNFPTFEGKYAFWLSVCFLAVSALFSFKKARMQLMFHDLQLHFSKPKKRVCESTCKKRRVRESFLHVFL
jgi:hypothetical protein